MVSKFLDGLVVVIKQRETTEAAPDAMNETIDSVTKIEVFSLAADRTLSGEMGEEKWHIDHNFIYSRGRGLRYPINGF